MRHAARDARSRQCRPVRCPDVRENDPRRARPAGGRDKCATLRLSRLRNRQPLLDLTAAGGQQDRVPSGGRKAEGRLMAAINLPD